MPAIAAEWPPPATARRRVSLVRGKRRASPVMSFMAGASKGRLRRRLASHCNCLDQCQPDEHGRPGAPPGSSLGKKLTVTSEPAAQRALACSLASAILAICLAGPPRVACNCERSRCACSERCVRGKPGDQAHGDHAGLQAGPNATPRRCMGHARGRASLRYCYQSPGRLTRA